MDRLATDGRERAETWGGGGLSAACRLLFDDAYYAERYPDVALSGQAPLEHYETVGALEGRQPHPLFDPEFWRRSLARIGVAAPGPVALVDYFERPETWNAAPHPLFDPSFYAEQLARRGLVADRHLPPLADMLSRKELPDSHDLFAADYYARQAELAGVALIEHPLSHYVRGGGRTGFDPHPLFSTDFYEASAGGGLPADITPLEHLLASDPFARADPCAEFSVNHYRRQPATAPRGPLAALRSYLAEGGAALLDPHPKFEARLYAMAHPDCLDPGETPLTHYVRFWLEAGFRHPPFFGAVETRRGRPPPHAPYDAILVSHELSLTGAPKILLKICEHLVRERGLRILTLAAKGGLLLDEFAEWSDVFDLSAFSDSGRSAAALVTELCDSMLDWGRPRFAIVNTACVSEIGAALAEAGLPVTTLVHELASGFSQAEFEAIFTASSHVVFPANFVRDEAHRTFELPAEKSLVAPQGLLDPSFGQGDARAARRALLTEIGAPDNAFLVLGCGTLDLRKGIDLFVRVAAAAVSQSAGRPIHFVWAGGGNQEPHSPYWYVSQDVIRGGLEDRVHFIGSKADTAAYFLGCDALIVTSRLDPFPCVVHEAMACAKPVVAFEGAGGAPEALVDGAGFVAPYGDTEAMAGILRDLAADDTLARDVGDAARRRVSERYSYFNYVEKLVATADPAHEPRLADASAKGPRRGRIIFARGDWRPDAGNTFVERLARGLADRGFEPEIVFTGLAAAVSSPANLPRVPYRFVASNPHERTGFVARCERLIWSVRAAAPAIYVHDLDAIASAVAPALPKTIGVLGLVAEADAAHLEQTGRLGRFWQRTAVASPEALAEVACAFPDQNATLIELPRGAPDPGPFRPRRVGGPLRVLCQAPPADRPDLVHFLRSVFAKREGEAFEVDLTLSGEPDELDKLRKGLGNCAEIRFIPSVSGAAMAELLRQFDVRLTLDAHLGALDLEEAMSLGTIVVAAIGRRPSWLTEPFVDGVTGFAAALTRPQKCRDILSQLADDPERRQGLARAAADAGRARRSDIDVICDRYAALFDEMLAELADGRRVKPEPYFRHPTLGALSLPPSLLVDPDLVLGQAAYDPASNRIDRLEATATHPGWMQVWEASPQTLPQTYGAAKIAWRDGGLEIDKPAGDGGVELQLPDNASHVLMVLADVRLADGGVTRIYSRTIAEPDSQWSGRTDRGSAAGAARLRFDFARDASICGLRICPMDEVGHARFEKLAVFAPARAGLDGDRPPVLALGEIIDFRHGGDAEEYLAGGWYAPEVGLRWTHGADGRIRFTVEQPGARLWALVRAGGTSALGSIDFELRDAEGEAAVWPFADDGWRLQSAVLDQFASREGAFQIDFETRNPTSMLTLGLSADPRKLGLAFRAVGVFPADVAPADVEAMFQAAAPELRFSVET